MSAANVPTAAAAVAELSGSFTLAVQAYSESKRRGSSVLQYIQSFRIYVVLCELCFLH